VVLTQKRGAEKWTAGNAQATDKEKKKKQWKEEERKVLLEKKPESVARLGKTRAKISTLTGEE